MVKSGASQVGIRADCLQESPFHTPWPKLSPVDENCFTNLVVRPMGPRRHWVVLGSFIPRLYSGTLISLLFGLKILLTLTLGSRDHIHPAVCVTPFLEFRARIYFTISTDRRILLSRVPFIVTWKSLALEVFSNIDVAFAMSCCDIPPSRATGSIHVSVWL